jgi:molybdate transport system substrate-binding protein
MNRRTILNISATIALGVALVSITAGSTVTAADIKLLCAVALHPAIDALIPDFEKSSGHKVTVAYGNAGAIADRFQKGEAADLVINTAPLMGQLRGKVLAGDAIIIAKVGVGVFVRTGAAKPDISSADAFKRSMLAARSVTYPDPVGGGASGIYMVDLLERLGVAGEMKPKTKLSPSAKVLYASVASGDIEIGSIKSAKSWLNRPSNSLARCRQRFRITPSSPRAWLPAAVRLKPQER